MKSMLALALVLCVATTAVAFIVSNIWQSPTIHVQGFNVVSSFTGGNQAIGTPTTMTVYVTNPNAPASKSLDFNITASAHLDFTTMVIQDSDDASTFVNSTLVGQYEQAPVGYNPGTYEYHFRTASGAQLIGTSQSTFTLKITVWTFADYTVSAWIEG